ncbi:MAG: triose-phosphate isomerase, partial [Nannocystaceae bacterium]|nr:triose-phosphate isomerase [Nannocystaceae bacterium]
MTNRITWVLGNWKQNNLLADATECARGIANGLEAALASPVAGCPEVRVGFAPTYLALAASAPFTRPAGKAWLLAQDVAAQESGAFTGEIGVAMLKEAGVDAAIVGHSERRASFGDTSALVGQKVANALSHDLTVVLCVGESLESRDKGDHETTVITQLSESLSKVDSNAIDARLVIAYEPVWAIGTGRTASPQQARDMHRAIRAHLREMYGDAGRDRSILYGGSVKPGNAAELLSAGDIDGFLVG